MQQTSFLQFATDFINRHPMLTIGALFVLLSSLSSLSTRKVKVNTNQRMAMAFFWAGIAFICLDLWRSNTLSFNKPKVETVENTELIHKELKRRATNYLEALASHDMDKVRNFFPNILDKYYDNYKLTFIGFAGILRREWRKINKETFDIEPTSWKYRSLTDGSYKKYIASFRYKHTLENKEGASSTSDKTMELTFDNAYKIYGIDTAIDD
jgi:hypothetical protein